MEKTIILIGGMPTTGKTTIARELSARLGLPWLSTDQTRLALQGAVSSDTHPSLMSGHGLSVEEFFQTYSPEEIAEREYQHGVEAWPGNKHLIENDFTWREGFIFEGVNILPSLLPTLKTNSDVRPIFLTDTGDEALRKAIFGRGLYMDAARYDDTIKEREMVWARLFDEHIIKEARGLGYPVVRIEKDTNSDMPKVLAALRLEL